MKSGSVATVAILGMVVGMVAVVVLSAVWGGVVLSILWGWFIVPLGAPALTVPSAVGVAMVVGFLTKQTPPKDDRSLGEVVTLAFINPLMALGLGWILHSFM